MDYRLVKQRAAQIRKPLPSFRELGRRDGPSRRSLQIIIAA
jgi:hypothetical protein